MPEAVLVLEDDPYIRRAIVRQLESDAAFNAVFEAGDLATARIAIEDGRATVGIFDLQLGDGSAIPLISMAVARGMTVLVLTVWDDDERVYGALAAGAGGYLLKGDSAASVLEALAVLREGGAPISPMIARRLLDEFRARHPAPTQPEPSKLTAREQEIIELFAKGATYEEVAQMLSMSVNTVRHHVRAMYKKLHVSSKAEAVTMAFRLA